MGDFIKNNKLFIGGIALVALGAALYFMFFSGGSSPTLTASDTASIPVSKELLVTLQNLQTLQFDDSIFKNPVFQSLSDFGVTIPQQQVGRRNPFAPLGQ